MKRDKDRRNQHAPHGWYRSTRPHCTRPGLVFIDCPCGWFGWIDEENAPTTTEPPAEAAG